MKRFKNVTKFVDVTNKEGVRIISGRDFRYKDIAKGHIAAAKIHRGKRVIMIHRPDLLTRSVWEHELAHIRLGHKGVTTFKSYCEYEVAAERERWRVMNHNTVFTTHKVANLLLEFHKEYNKRHKINLTFRQFVERLHNGYKYGLTDDEFNRTYKALVK
jgi:hypothetical protein